MPNSLLQLKECRITRLHFTDSGNSVMYTFLLLVYFPEIAVGKLDYEDRPNKLISSLCEEA